MKITYQQRPIAGRGIRPHYAVVVGGQFRGVVRRRKDGTGWEYLRDGEQFTGKRRQDAVHAGLAGLMAAADERNEP